MGIPEEYVGVPINIDTQIKHAKIDRRSFFFPSFFSDRSAEAVAEDVVIFDDDFLGVSPTHSTAHIT